MALLKAKLLGAGRGGARNPQNELLALIPQNPKFRPYAADTQKTARLWGFQTPGSFGAHVCVGGLLRHEDPADLTELLVHLPCEEGMCFCDCNPL